jgi:hypothetical protein
VAENNQLRQLFEEDQALRRGWTGKEPPSLGLVVRLLWSDSRRRRRLRRLMQSGALQAGEDYYHAAMLLQHSPRARDYWQAHQLAERAVELGHRPARWLVAASLDRWLLAQGRPQKYGTQYIPADRPRWVWWVWWGVRRVRLWDVDPSTTDEERRTFGVPPLAEARAQAEMMFAQHSLSRLGPSLAQVALGHLMVEVQDVRSIMAIAPAGIGNQPHAEPVQPGDKPVHVTLPPGLTICRAGGALGAASEGGDVAVVWRRHRVGPNEPFVYGWRWDQPPLVENVALTSQPAIWVGGEPDGSAAVITLAGPDACWCIWGRLSREELLRLADSLPTDPVTRIA